MHLGVYARYQVKGYTCISHLIFNTETGFHFPHFINGEIGVQDHAIDLVDPEFRLDLSEEHPNPTSTTDCMLHHDMPVTRDRCAPSTEAL